MSEVGDVFERVPLLVSIRVSFLAWNMLQGKCCRHHLRAVLHPHFKKEKLRPVGAADCLPQLINCLLLLVGGPHVQCANLPLLSTMDKVTTFPTN